MQSMWHLLKHVGMSGHPSGDIIGTGHLKVAREYDGKETWPQTWVTLAVFNTLEEATTALQQHREREELKGRAS